MNVIYQAGDFFVLKAAKGYEVCKNTGVHSEVVARIGAISDALTRAIAECDRRHKAATA